MLAESPGHLQAVTAPVLLIYILPGVADLNPHILRRRVSEHTCRATPNPEAPAMSVSILKCKIHLHGLSLARRRSMTLT
ncbi:hypothetical protein BDR04DRAFT_1101079 [Suillus decipiens]|nr:hypothetical protein BDR04DRAFT_1101079 [Suillus decipiens]